MKTPNNEKIHVDTDIGGDIDDLCALAMLLKWPGVEITAITTVAEAHGKRAGYARYVLQLAGRGDIPVAAGADVSLGCYRFRPGYLPEERYWPEPVAPSPNDLQDALDLLRRSIEQNAVVMAIGPYTNLSLLERRYPGILRGANLYLMGGYVNRPKEGFPQWGHEADYNVQLDSLRRSTLLSRASQHVSPLK